jgi:hypothetical protein
MTATLTSTDTENSRIHSTQSVINHTDKKINDQSNVSTNARQTEAPNYMTFRANAKQSSIYNDSSDEAEDLQHTELPALASNLRINSLNSKDTERVKLSNFPITSKLSYLQTYQQSESLVISAGQCHICRKHLIDESAHCVAHINGRM